MVKRVLFLLFAMQFLIADESSIDPPEVVEQAEEMPDAEKQNQVKLSLGLGFGGTYYYSHRLALRGEICVGLLSPDEKAGLELNYSKPFFSNWINQNQFYLLPYKATNMGKWWTLTWGAGAGYANSELTEGYDYIQFDSLIGVLRLVAKYRFVVARIELNQPIYSSNGGHRYAYNPTLIFNLGPSF